MISKAEREHIQKIKRWSADGRKAISESVEHPVLGKLLKKLTSEQASPTLMFDNLDWLIALMERELHTQGVKSLLAAVEAHEKATR